MAGFSLFESARIGGVELRNRIVRSSTNEYLADPETGAPTQKLADLYEALAAGGLGLIVTGQSYVADNGKMKPKCNGMHIDDLIGSWRKAIRPAQEAQAKVFVQLNHCGAASVPDGAADPISPSGLAMNAIFKQSREMTADDILEAIDAFSEAAERARSAGFDGVQISAGKSLIGQFLIPRFNTRTDRWGGSPENRRAFLVGILQAVREKAGDDYPVWVKLGVGGAEANGPSIEEGVGTAIACAKAGADCLEISHGLGRPPGLEPKPGEPTLLPLVRAVRTAMGPEFPLVAVEGFSKAAQMEEVLEDGTAQLISLSRPLIAEPDLPRRIRDDPGRVFLCDRCNRCWPKEPDDITRCRNEKVLRAAG